MAVPFGAKAMLKMADLDVALASKAKHWQQSEAAKLEISCEDGSLNIQLNAKLTQLDILHFYHPSSPSCKRKCHSQLRWQERRRHAARINVDLAKPTHNLHCSQQRS